MKKAVIIILSVAVAAVALYAIYGFGCRKAMPKNATMDEQVLAILEHNGCMMCHAMEPKKPFYAEFPVMKDQMAAHILHAQRFADLQEKMTNPSQVDEVTLAKMEHCVLENTMPIIQFRMVHWGTGFSAKEKGILAEWIATVRAQRYASKLNSEAMANEPIQALPEKVETCAKKVDLGKRMYYDKRISLDGTISCATCHILEQGGVSNPAYRTSEGIYGQFGGVNAPTVYNSYYNVQQFWNGRAANLQEQAAGPPANPVEMGDQTWDEIVARLSKDKALVKEFQQIYPGVGLTQATVTDAIAEFEKTLLTPNSPFDQYLKGNADAISQEAKDGYAAFKKNSCAACHVGKIAGGQSFEYLGVYNDYFAERDASIVYNGDDDGLKGFTGKECDLHKFKVPGLRLVSLTAPYFHDGSMATMEEAVKAMGRYELGIELDDATVNQIVAFMKTL